ncbi:MAG: efflux RND transporter periplasmic adaptor subunit [Melioribacteraceae bacterium]|nr:efflux RND transporter periplasmic adaptor subunit [Melioribacteraceae bacterium]
MRYPILIFLILLLMNTACEQETEQVVEKRVPVKIFKAQADSITKYFSVTGSISASEDVVIYSKVSERVDNIFVKPGDRVKEGQTLLIQYNQVLMQNVNAAQTAVENAETQLEQIKQDFGRMKMLYSQKAISTQQFDQISTQLKSAELGYEQAQVQLKLAKEQYDNSKSRAPFSGLVASVYVELNQMVPMGQPVVKLINPAGMKAKLKVAGEEISMIQKGQEVVAKFPSLPGKEHAGRITKIDQAVDPLSKTLEVEVAIEEHDSKLKSGMFGEFFVEMTKKINTVIIPENAIQSRTEVNVDRSTGLQNAVRKFFVFLVDSNKAELRQVSTGISDNGRIEITSGIEIGDSIIVVGQNIVKAGQTVNVID